MKRVYNFSAGPSTLPVEVLEKAAKEMLSYGDAGMSVMEMSHRSSSYNTIIVEAEQLLRELLEVPDNYRILFLQGGASTQFAMIPLNLYKNKKADYIDTGAWSAKAIAEAKRYGDVKVVASSKDSTYNYLPEVKGDELRSDADYVYITSNNTIYGTQFNDFIDTKGIPLVADMSSDIMSRQLDISKFGVIFAGAQKNMGPAGVTVVIIRDDLIGSPLDFTPTMLNYKTHSDKDSMFNTPPTYSIYMCKLVFEWLKNLGGLSVMEAMNKEKAALLYDYIDKSDLFKGTVKAEDRSLMNIPFVTGDKELDALFIQGAQERGLMNLKGHRSVGGMRASIYNAMPKVGVETLVKYMEEFEKENN